MDSIQQVELATRIATASGGLLREPGCLSDEILADVLRLTKLQWIHWWSELGAMIDDFHADKPCARHAPGKPHSILTDFFHCEVLTRVWAALLHAAADVCPILDCDGIGRSMLFGHLQARHLALRLLIQGRQRHDESFAQLDGLRRTTELWTDVLLAFFQNHVDVTPFGFDAQRIQLEAQHRRPEIFGSTHVRIRLHGLRYDMVGEFRETSPRPAESHNRHDLLCETIQKMLDTVASSPQAPSSPLWQMRMLANTNESTTALRRVR
jgi:hypothetical protein